MSSNIDYLVVYDYQENEWKFSEGKYAKKCVKNVYDQHYLEEVLSEHRGIPDAAEEMLRAQVAVSKASNKTSTEASHE